MTDYQKKNPASHGSSNLADRCVEDVNAEIGEAFAGISFKRQSDVMLSSSGPRQLGDDESMSSTMPTAPRQETKSEVTGDRPAPSGRVNETAQPAPQHPPNVRLCQICGCPTHTDGKPYVVFFPTMASPWQQLQQVVVHVFCGKMARLAKPSRPEYEILSRGQIETKYKGYSPTERAEIAKFCRSAHVRIKQLEGNNTDRGSIQAETNLSTTVFYLTREVDSFLAARRWWRP